MLYSYTVTNSGERRLKVPGVPYCSVTSLSENRVVILIGWLSKHSYNYTFKLLREILAGLLFDIHRIACLRRVSVNFKFLSILSQTAKWTFPVSCRLSKIWLVNKTELRIKKQFGKSTRTALLFRILGSIVVRFFDNKLMFVFILCLYSQTMELYSHLEQFCYTV